MRIFLLSEGCKGEGTYTLKKRESQYLLKVLRLKDGDVFTAKDPQGCFYTASIAGDTLLLKPTEKPEETLLDGLSAYKGRIYPVKVCQCICKGKKNEDIVRMLTEAGCEEVVFLKSRFSQSDHFSEHDLQRLETIRREAIQQSGSSTAVTPFRTITIEELCAEEHRPIIFLHQSQRGSTRLLKEVLASIPSAEGVAIVVGSEGGFSEEECEYLEAHGALCALLQTNILRAETAGIYALGVIQNFFPIP